MFWEMSFRALSVLVASACAAAASSRHLHQIHYHLSLAFQRGSMLRGRHICTYLLYPLVSSMSWDKAAEPVPCTLQNQLWAIARATICSSPLVLLLNTS